MLVHPAFVRVNCYINHVLFSVIHLFFWILLQEQSGHCESWWCSQDAKAD
jgi:hypothetical protein